MCPSSTPEETVNRRGRLLAAIGLVALTLLTPLAAPAIDDTLRVGIFPRRHPELTRELFQPMAEHLAAALGRPVEVETTADFASFWQNVERRRYDLVHFNQYHYVRSHTEHGYRVILRNEEFGHADISAAIVVRKDSGIEKLDDLRGKKIVFGGGRTAMLAYIAATHLLNEAGLKQGDYFEQFALTPPKACIAAFYRQAAAAGAGNYVLDLPKVKDEVDVGEMEYLATGMPLAHLPWAVKADMDDDTARSIQQILIALKHTDAGRAVLKQARLTALVAATDRDYDRHREIIRAVLGERY